MMRNLERIMRNTRMNAGSRIKNTINMKAVVNMWLKPWVIMLLFLAGAWGNAVRAQNVPGCDPLGRTPLVDFQLTYDPATNRYTAWYIPTDNTLHRTVTGQFTIIAPNGFTTPLGNGRDSDFQITNLNGTWTDFVLDNELITSVGATPLGTLNGLAVHQVGMAPAGIDIDPDGPAGPLTTMDPVIPGVAVPLFSFPGTGCASALRILVNGEPVRNDVLSVFGANLNNEITIQIPRAAFVPALERYCKNAPLSSPTIVLPDIQDDTKTLCATTTSYSDNYFTQVLRNWNPANLPAGTTVVSTANQVWGNFTVTQNPNVPQATVVTDPVSGTYTITFPTVNGVTQPGSVTICNSLRDVCNTSVDQACVVISWLSSGTVSIANNPPVCLSNGTATASLTATSGFSTYDWSGPGLTTSTGNPVTVTLSAPGVYSYTVLATTAGSCTATATTSLTIVNGANVSSFTMTNPTSCSGADGTVTLNGLASGQSYSVAYTKNGTGQPAQTLIANGSGQITVTGLSAGVYSFTVLIGVCASTPISVTLTDPNPPATPTLPPSATICLGNSLTLTATGAANASFTWTGQNLMQTTGNPVTASPGTAGSFVYTVTQTVGGCVSAPASMTVTVNPAPMVTATALSATACVGGSLSLSATPSGGTPGYSFTWTGPNFSTTTTANPVTIANATLANTGNYSVQVTDANQCTATSATPVAVSVINCCSLTATASATQMTICVGGSTTLSATTTGSLGALSYQWSPNVVLGNSQSVTVTPVSTTTYTVVVTDSGAPNCTSIATVTVFVNPNPVIANLTATPACVGQVLSLSATLTGGSQPVTSTWRTPDGLTLSGNPLTRSNAQITMSGAYTLTVSDVNSCTAAQVVSTTVGAAPTVQVQPQQACAGGNVTLSASGGASSYSWTGPNGFTASGPVIVLTGVDASDAGSYTVVVTGGNACTGTAVGVVAVNPAPVIKADFVAASVCTGSSLNLLGDITTGTVPPYIYSWTGPNGYASSLQNPIITPAQVSNSGSYTFVVTDLNGCSVTATTPVSVTVADCCPPRTASISFTAEDPSCNSSDGSVNAMLLPASPVGTLVTYLWKNVATNAVVGNTASVSALTAGVYSVTITETTGNCVQIFTGQVPISDTPGPDVSVASISGANCGATNGGVQLIVTGGTTPYTVSWSGASTGSMNAPGSPVQINGLSAGNYIFTVTGIGSSCRGLQNVSIPVLPTSLSLATQVFQPVTCGTSGTIVVSWNSVGGPYQLTVDGVVTPVSGTSRTLIIGAGTHSIQIASGNPLCVSDSKVVTINPVPAPAVSGWAIQQQPNCAGQTGIITFGAGQSSSTQYTLAYLNNTLIASTTGDIPRTYTLGAGVYVITRLEPTGCITTQTLEIVAPPAISFNVQPTDGTCGQPGSLVVTNITGGMPGYVVSYTGPVSGTTTAGASSTGLIAGMYTVTVTDSRGCLTSTTVTIGGGQGPAVTATISSATACVGSSFVLNAAVTPVGSYTYTWRGPNNFTATGAMVTVNSASLANSGSYTVVVTNATGCSTTQVTTTSIGILVCQPPCAIGLNVVSTSAHCNQMDGQATVTASGGSGSYTYRWNTGATTPTLSALATGVYSVTVTDAANTACFSTTLVSVGNAGGPQLTVASITPASCVGATGAASVTASGGSPAYTYQWSTGSVTAGINAVVAGVYSVTVTDQSGCKDVTLVTIPSTPGNLTATISGTASACGQATGTATVTASGSSGYQYLWSTGAMTASVSGLSAGTYTVKITDVNQCSVTAVVSINDVSGPQFTINKTNVSCQGGATGTASVNVTSGIAPVSYLWSTGAVTSSISGLAAGIYTVIVTDGNGCKTSDQITITQPLGIVAELSASTIACGTTTGNITLVSVSGGSPAYTYLWSNGANTPSLTGVGAGSYTLTVTDALNCVARGTATLSLPTNCTVCQKPVLEVTGPVCNTATNTYSISYLVSAGATVSASGGTVNAALSMITGIPSGQNVVVTATSGCGSVSSFTIVAPNCTVPSCTQTAGLKVGQPVCNGTSYVVSVTANAGATITAFGGTMNGGLVTVVGTSNVTIVASIAGCATSETVIVGGIDCTTPTVCTNPLVSVAGTSCETASYSVKYFAPAGVTVTASSGVVNALTQTITGIQLGIPVSLTASNGTCMQVIPVPAPGNCVTCQKPILTVGAPVCNGNTYSVRFYVGSAGMVMGSVSSNVGTIGNNIISNIPVGTPVVITASTGAGCDNTMTVESPVSCTTGCVPPQLTVGQPICNGATYAVSFAVDPGTSVTANAGNVNGNTISNVPAGTNLVVTAGTGNCTTRINVGSPDCTNPCLYPGISLSGPICRPGGASYYFNYIATAGTTVTISQGGTVNQATGTIEVVAGAGAGASLLVNSPGCPASGIVLPPASCTYCSKPTLTAGRPVCNGNTYSVSFFSSTTSVSSNVGTINGNTISNIPLGTPVGITATTGVGCESTLTVQSPASCTTGCVPPQLEVGQPICDLSGNVYLVSFAAESGVTVTTTNGSINQVNHTITIPLGTSAVISAGSGNCVTNVEIKSPDNCSTPCVNPGISIGGTVCETGTTTYTVNFTTTTGTTVVASSGQVNQATGKITGILLGTPVSLTVSTLPIADFTGPCLDKVILIPAPTNCPVCQKPVLEVTGPVCNTATNTYSISYLVSAGATVSASGGTVNAALNLITGIPSGQNVVVTATSGCGSVSSFTVVAPNCTVPPCVLVPGLKVGQPVCNGTSYVVSVTANAGATITALGGTMNGGLVTVVGTSNVTIVASIAGCATSETVIVGGIDCTTPTVCANPLVSVAGTSCETASYSVKYFAPAGVTVTASSGVLNAVTQMITGIPLGTPVSLTASNGSCPPQVVNIPAPMNCPQLCPTRDISLQSVGTQCGLSTGSATAMVVPAAPAGATVTYQWTNLVNNATVGNTSSLNGLSAGLYRLLVTITQAGLTCTYADTAIINQSDGIQVTPSTLVGADCGLSNGSLVFTATGGTSPYTVRWSGAATGTMTSASPIAVTGLISGNYSFTISSAGNTPCVSYQTISVPQRPSSLSLTANGISPTACGTNNGSISLSWTAVPGNSTYQLTVNGVTTTVAGTSTVLSGLSSGAYTISVATSGIPTCASSTTTVMLNSTQAPAVSNWSVNQPNCAGQMGSLVFLGGQSPTVFYTITQVGVGMIGFTNGATAQSFAVGSGNYIVTRTEGSCVSSQTYGITVPSAIDFNVQVTPATCGQPGSLVVTDISGGTPQFVVMITNAANQTVSAGNLPAGTYTVTVTDSKGCSVGEVVTITGSGLPDIASIIANNPTTCTGTDGSLVLTGLLANQGYQVCYTKNGNSPVCSALIANGIGQLTIAGLGAGIYTNITVSIGGCISIPKSATLNNPVNPPTPLSINPGVVCLGQSFTLVATGTPGATIQWVGPGGFMATGSPAVVTPTTTGMLTYTVTQTVSGCTSMPATVTALVNPTPSITQVASTNPTSCTLNDGTITLTGPLPNQIYTVCFSFNGGNSICQSLMSNPAGQLILTNLSAGAYSNITISAFGCQVAVPVSATLNGPLTPPTPQAPNPGTICQGQSVVLTAGGSVGAFFQWSGPGVTASGNPVTVTPSTTGTLTYFVTQTVNGCTSAPATVTLVVNPAPTVTATISSATACAGSSFVLNATVLPSGNYTYTWKGPNNFTANGAVVTVNPATLANSGSYTVVVTGSAAGCSVTKETTTSIAVTNCTVCQKPVLEVTGPVCNTATNTYSISYLVSAGATVSASGGTVNAALSMITGIPSGQNVVVTATSGCGSVSSFTVVAPNCTVPPCVLVPGLKVGQPVCNGTSYVVSVTANAGATITAFGGTMNGGLVTVVGTSNVTIVASIAGCATSETVIVGGIDCTTPTVCTNPLVSVAGTSCETASYSVKYFAPAGVTVTASSGMVNAVTQMITGIPLGTPVSLTASNGSCPPQVVNIPAPMNCNEPPLVPGHPVVTEPGKPVTVCLPITDPNVGDTHTVTLCAQPAHGTVSLPMTVNNQTHTVCFTYTPTVGYTGLDQVCLITCDQGGLCDTTYVPITIVPTSPTTTVGKPPVVPVTPIVTITGEPKTECYPILDPNVGDVHSYTICGQPQHGQASVSINNTTHQICVTYTPTAGYSGPDELCLHVCDQTGLCTDVTIPIVVIPKPGPPTQPQPPTVVPPVIITPVDVPQTVCVQINDPNFGDIHTATICGQPSAGTITVGAVNNVTHMVCVTYTPPAGYSGQPLGGCLQVCDQTGLCTQVPITITVIPGPSTNEPPLVPGHPVVTEPGKPVTVCLPITDPNVGDTHTVTLCAQPAHGTVSLPMTVNNQTHTVCFTYTPTVGYTGLDQVCLITCDQGGLCDTTYVPITIVPTSPTTTVGKPPVVPVTPIVTITGEPKTECYPILDPNVGDVHSYTICGQPQHGQASVSINNTTHQICVTYTPTAGYSGPDELCLHVCDQTGLCTDVTIPIVVIPKPGPPTQPQPPTVVPPVIITPVDVPQTVCVQINDPNFGDIHTATICGQPSAGTITVGAVNNVTHMVCVTYTPPAGYSGQPLGGCLQVCDQTGLCTQVPITITVIPGTTPPCPTIAVLPFPSDPTTCTANNGSLTLTGLTAGQSYTVCYTKNLDAPFCQTLTANQNGRILVTGLGVGVYSNITTSRNGCMSNAVSVTLVGGLPAPSATCSVTAVCVGESITLTASGTNIQWQGPGLQSATGSPVTAIPNVTGIVTYMATQSANGCVSPPATVTVVVKPTPTFSVSATNPTVCNGPDGSITLMGLTPGQSYTVCYTKDAGQPVCAERLANVNGVLTITGLSAGSYTNITVTELGCISLPKAVVLTNPALPNPVITVAPGTTVCLGQPLSLTATGQPGASFTWKGQGLLGTTGSVVTVNPQSTGTLSYTVTQSIVGCGSSWTAISITVNPVPSATLISKNDPGACANPNGAITMGGLLSNQTYTVCYRVNNVGSAVCLQLASNNVGNIVMNGLTAGAYSVTVSNGGCSSQPVSATLVGQTPAQPNVSVSPSATICIGQSVTLTASSNLDGPFTWTGLDLSSIAGGVATALPTTTGVRNYTVIQTVNGCTSIPAIVPITVMAIPAPTLVTSTAPTACSGTNGSVTLGGLTANQSYTVCYSKAGAATQCAPFVAAGNGQLVVTGLTSGAYSLTVLSAGGCRNTVPVSASVASSTACSQCTDAPLIIAQPLLICKDSTKTVTMQILDADLSDSFSATVCGVGTSNATVTVGVDNQTRQLFITYKGAPGFQGIDQVCVTVTDKCGNFDQVYVPIQVIRCVCGCTGTPPVVIPQPIITTKNNPKEICVPIVDTPTDVHTATICGGPQNGTAEITVNNTTHMLCVKYTPNANYVGTDKVCITICDQTNRCTVIEVPITVVDIPNPPALSIVPVVTNCSSTTSAYMPILDINADNTHSVMVLSQPLNGTITATVDQVTHRILITYIPAPGFTGNDKAVIRVTDSDGLSSPDTDVPLFVTPGTCLTCVTLELKVLLEGPYNTSTHKMNTVLNQRGLLPGQTPIGQFAVATPAGQPYNTAPWNYTGTESVTTYDQDVVDWVLVSLRADELSTTPVFRVAGLLHDDGRITFVNPCFNIPAGSYHAVVEHRNHMGVMSPTKVTIVNNKLLFDFTVQDSYTIADPPSFGEIAVDGKWMMYGGDGKKDVFSDNFDINFFDSKLWKDESGIFDQYRYGDFNMDADVNFVDSVLWKKNNGRYSKVPH